VLDSALPGELGGCVSAAELPLVVVVVVAAHVVVAGGLSDEPEEPLEVADAPEEADEPEEPESGVRSWKAVDWMGWRLVGVGAISWLGSTARWLLRSLMNSVATREFVSSMVVNTVSELSSKGIVCVTVVK